MGFVKLSYLLIFIMASHQTIKAEPVTYENLPLGTQFSPLILRTYMPDPGLEEGYFAHYGKGEKSAKYNPGSGKDAKGEVTLHFFSHVADISVTSATYQPRWTYGSQPENQITHKISEIKKTDDHSIAISISDMQVGRVYEIKLPKLLSSNHEEIHNQLFYYTVHKIPAQ